MISKTEAKEEYRLMESSQGFVSIGLIDYIYDSIGKCKDCKYRRSEGHCALYESIVTDDKWFCSDFERHF